MSGRTPDVPLCRQPRIQRETGRPPGNKHRAARSHATGGNGAETDGNGPTDINIFNFRSLFGRRGSRLVIFSPRGTCHYMACSSAHKPCSFSYMADRNFSRGPFSLRKGLKNKEAGRTSPYLPASVVQIYNIFCRKANSVKMPKGKCFPCPIRRCLRARR